MYLSHHSYLIATGAKTNIYKGHIENRELKQMKIYILAACTPYLHVRKEKWYTNSLIFMHNDYKRDKGRQTNKTHFKHGKLHKLF